MSKPKLDVYTPEEEQANALTHATGIVLGLVGLLLVIIKVPVHDAARFWSCIIFCVSIILLYAASTAYHSVKAKKQKYLFKQLDHIAIYILIAGTFTPFAWGVLGSEAFGINMLLGVWLIALAGIIFKIFFTGRFEAISLLSYLAMGWLGFLMFDRISTILGSEVVNLMIYGGVCYTTGIIFYLMRRLKYHHAIWHLFVLGGTSFHYWAVLNHIVY
ncbi:hypothetical protein BFP97_15030 [Roseivirga sp. 4D4]|uniref:PAQR family membrane homeostasis protein TrhA n=1 Tax=Roseivirga sp. 4D4 TaxID=1889784 RepID=UPI0008535A72|nr:hemolysin III family protein [Roseivirga sp. 4D4]OEK02758.1 hypothetical protein BFP97_15030 [Roseivirga sp. 4D4]